MDNIAIIDVTEVVGKALAHLDDSSDETDIEKAGIFDLMDALSGKDNDRFSVDEAKAELKARGVF